jgi:Flp pilus assembly protein TadB
MRPTDEDVRDILNKYNRKVGSYIDSYDSDLATNEAFSKEYIIFREESMTGALSTYENLCNFSESLIKISPKDEERENLEDAIKTAHLNITPDGATSFATMIMFSSILAALLIGLAVFIITGGLPSTSIVLLLLLIMLAGFAMTKPLSKLPMLVATKWRLRASNQMVMCILYIVMYMRHTSNMEHAIKFAGEHIGNPLALDMRKVFWDVEVGKYSTLKESLDHYLVQWRKHNLEFVEAFHLIESSLYEPDEARRVDRLEKSLQVILEGTYERMLHFAHDVKAPITFLHMIGIILPILGLIILPLMGTFLGVKWWHLAIVYNLILPVGVYYMGINVLQKRPMGYGERNIIEEIPDYERYTKADFMGLEVDAIIPAMFIGIIFLLIGTIPLLAHAVNPMWDYTISDKLGNVLDYRNADGMPCKSGEDCFGPFGIGAVILSIIMILGVGIAIGTYYKIRTKKLMVIRERTRELEREFAGSLFQLGNRIGDGIPTELAVGNVAENMRGTPTGQFFGITSINIKQLGMGVKDAIFDSKRGAILAFPSTLIESSMKVLVESARKGPQVVAKCLISISVYMERIHQVSERLKDLLAEITTSMKSQISFLTPMIAGVVVGIGSMITSVIGRLSTQIGSFTAGGADTASVPFNVQKLIGIFPTDKLMPPYYFQLVVGVYVIEIIIILTYLANAIENGDDRLTEKNRLGKNLYISVFFYCMLALAITLVFSLLGGLVATLKT